VLGDLASEIFSAASRRDGFELPRGYRTTTVDVDNCPKGIISSAPLAGRCGDAAR